MNEYYGKEDYVSVWIGKCSEEELFNEYIELKAVEGDFSFELGNDFGISSYDEDFSLVYYRQKGTKNLKVLLDTGVPKYVIKHFVKKAGRFLKEEFNCCVMFCEMDYTGEVKEVINEKFGKFVYLGSMVFDMSDMLEEDF